MGTVYQRNGRGPWWIAWQDLHGRRHWESARDRRRGIAGTKADATRLLALREGATAEGRAVTPQTGRLTLEHAIEAVIQDHEQNSRRSTGRLRPRAEQHLYPFFGQLARLTSITTALIAEYVAHRRQEQASAATVNRELALLRRAFRLAHRREQIAAVPHFALVDESRTARQGFLEPADFARVRAALTPAVYADVATFAYVTGWRVPSEVLVMTWAHVDMRAGLLRIEPGTTKGGEGRQFPITETLRALLTRRTRAKRAGCPLVFHQAGEAITPRMFRTRWDAACTAADVAGRLPHDMRRSAVRNLERANIPRKVAMQMVGHRTESIYRRYHIVAEDDIHEAGARLDHLTPDCDTFVTIRKRRAAVKPRKPRKH